MARATELLTEAGEATGATMRRAVDEVHHNWRDHRHALQTIHETAMVSAEFGHGWRERLERHLAVLVTMGGRAGGGPHRPRAAVPPGPTPRASTASPACAVIDDHSEGGGHRQQVDPQDVSQEPGPVSPRYRGHVREVSPSYRGHGGPAQRVSTNASTAATTSGLKASASRAQTERVHRRGR